MILLMSTNSVSISNMSEFHHISSRDTSAYTEILEIASKTLLDVATTKAEQGFTFLLEAIENNEIASGHHCVSTTDAVTRAAYSLGITASREWHGQHFITSFGELDALPSDDDPILCMTWGQMFRSNSKPISGTEAQPYYGSRRGILDLLPNDFDHYSPFTVSERHIVHRPDLTETPAHEWLITSQVDVLMGDYFIQEAGQSDYADKRWCK